MRAVVPVVFFAAACGAQPAAIDCAFTTQLVQSPRGDLVQLVADDGAACVKLRRAAVDLGDGAFCKACPYRIDELVVGVEGVVHVIDDPDRLFYDPSHHNWDDAAWANLDDGTTVAVRMTYGDPWTYALERYAVADDDGVDVIPLVPWAPVHP